ncbi:MAG: radical SAM protein [Candidatus Omnitrophica bacterium]|nr:radical SAM protein [Candidatus Omnitrophota bacterium]MDD5670073.1 radical SAM protein [Candidatus Omnitrophota bacterium]
MKVVLVYPPIPHITTSTSPPVGLAYLASILKQKKAEVAVVSSDAEEMGVEATTEKILSLSPDMVGISISTPTFNNAVKIIGGIQSKDGNIKIQVGGPHATLFPDELLNLGVDFVIRGEGEVTMSELCDYFENNIALEKIDGLSYKADGRNKHNPDRELIADLDSLPYPSWELFPIHRYKSDFRKKEFTLPVLSSRGCPARCTFCYKDIFGSMFRVRSPKNIVGEIEYLKSTFHIEEFAIIDDSFTSIPKRAMEVCDLIVERKINLPWTLPAGIRVPTVSAELLQKLKTAGCYRAGLGIESGNQDILRSISKGITLEQVRRAVRLVKESGIESAGYFMIGNLEETEETIEQTIRFAIELDPDYAQFTKTTPYPGTAIYKQLKSENRIVTDNWDDYDSFLKGRPTFTHKNLTNEQIDAKLREAYRRFYYRPKYILKHMKTIASWREIKTLLSNTLKFFKSYSA